jgi:tellurite resistance protein TerC
MQPDTILWSVFGVVVVAVLVIDMFVLSRGGREMTMARAARWSAVWVSLALGFNVLVGVLRGWDSAAQFFTAYLIEESLSVDNLFVFLAVFRYFAVPPKLQHRVLFWGILCAMLMRAGFLVAGTALISRFDWMMYVFGIILLASGAKLFGASNEALNPGDSAALRIARRFMRTSEEFDGEKFITRINGRLHATPLLLTLVVIELTDVLFAVDSVPAVLGISHDLFIVYTSNIFAILGLRSMYFLLQGAMDKFHLLGKGLALILTFIGAKMLGHAVVHVPIFLSLTVVLGILVGSIALSLILPPKAHPVEPDAR